jgi:hypothetical protein
VIELRWIQFGILPDMKRLEHRQWVATGTGIEPSIGNARPDLWGYWTEWKEVPTVIQDTLGKSNAEA